MDSTGGSIIRLSRRPTRTESREIRAGFYVAVSTGAVNTDPAKTELLGLAFPDPKPWVSRSGGGAAVQ